MDQDTRKLAAAQAALDYVLPKLNADSIVGIGTGSTTNFFIDLLAQHQDKFDACVSSSLASTERLQKHGIHVMDLTAAPNLAVYIDGADETNASLSLIKGGGAALTREKIVAAVADEFICIIDDSKLVDVLGAFPLPVEVIPMARSHVARELVKLGGDPVLREGVTTDNGNLILDVFNFMMPDPKATEIAINAIVGVVCNGLFADRGADVVFMATADGIKRL